MTDQDAPLFVVMWRTRSDTRLQVQPFVYTAGKAAHVAGQLARQFGGEAFTVPIELPEGTEVTKEYMR